MTRLFLRIYFTKNAWIGPGKVELLEAIRDHRSISAAARTMGMSYRRAWLLIDGVNRLFGERAVETTLGGRNGGRAVVTPLGRDIIKRYRAMERAARRAIARQAAPLARRVERAHAR
jgi:molybdate transport system regulatory protein